MTVPMCPDRWLADKLFHGQVRSLPDGRMRVAFSGETATLDYWRPYFDRLGISCVRKPDAGETRREQILLMLKRLELQFPEARAALANLRDAWTVNSSSLDWPLASELLKGIFRRFLCSVDNPTTTTLSQLGSDLLNDSKALRDGRGRALLGLVLGAMGNELDADERELFKRYGIVENPYTTFVTCHVPFESEALHSGDNDTKPIIQMYPSERDLDLLTGADYAMRAARMLPLMRCVEHLSFSNRLGNIRNFFWNYCKL